MCIVISMTFSHVSGLNVLVVFFWDGKGGGGVTGRGVTGMGMVTGGGGGLGREGRVGRGMSCRFHMRSGLVRMAQS